MPFGRSLVVLAVGFAFALAACGETTPNSEDGTGGASGTNATGGAPTGGNAGATTGGQSGTTGQAGGGSGGGSGGTAGTGGAGQAGAGGSSGATGGGGMASGAGGGAGGPAGAGGQAGAGGRGGAGGNAGAAGMAGGAGRGGSGGTGGYNPCPAAPAPCVILPFGDSITDGFNIPGGYRIELFQRTLSAGQRITFVGSGTNGPTRVAGVLFPQNHEGHTSYTIDGISPLVPTAIGFNPNIVLLMIGTNDLNNNVDVAQAPTRLGNLLDAMFTRRADMLVVVAQIVPGRQETLNTKVMTYNQAILGLVSTRAGAGRHIISVDMYTAFTRDANYKTALLADDLHPTTAGYARMADTWYAAIGPLLH